MQVGVEEFGLAWTRAASSIAADTDPTSGQPVSWVRTTDDEQHTLFPRRPWTTYERGAEGVVSERAPQPGAGQTPL